MSVQPQRALAALLPLAAAGALSALLSGLPWAAGAIAVGLAAMAYRRPEHAALFVVGFAPLGAAVGIVVDQRIPWTDLTLAAASAGWLGRKWKRAEPWPAPALAATALAWTSVALASALALWWASIWATVPPPMTWLEWAQLLWRDLVQYAPLRQSLRLAWGAVAVVWIAEAAREDHLRFRLTRLLVVSVSAIAVVSLYRLAEIALRSTSPLDRAIEVVQTLRIAPLVGDVNSLGALLLLAIPMAFQLVLTRGQRLLGLATLAMLLGASWLAGSRSAMAVILLALAATAALRSEWGRRPLAWGAAAGLGMIALGIFLLAPTGRHVEPSLAWVVRRDMGIAAARMLRDDPLFGVGLGQFHARSTTYMPDTVRKYYARENAHNQFLQVAGELGIPGLVALVGLLTAAVWPALRWRPPEAAGTLCGVLGFLVASLAQHPLLDPNVAVSFWLALGLLAAHGTRVGPQERRWYVVAAGAVVVILLVVPLQAVRRLGGIDLTSAVTGARALEEVGGRPYWRTGGMATMYLSAGVTRCVVTFRLGGYSGEAALALKLNHRDAGTAIASGHSWRSLEMRLPSLSTRLAHRRLDISWANGRPRGATIDLQPLDCR